jgi:hypothetical protein
MSDQELIQQWLKGNKVKKLPDGEVIGAHDLEDWAKRRAQGGYGAGPDRSSNCKRCGRVFEARTMKLARDRVCPDCRDGKRWAPWAAEAPPDVAGPGAFQYSRGTKR